MKRQDYILLITNCKKYKDKSNIQKLTWLRKLPSFIKFYHIIGNPALESEYIFDDSTNVLFVKTPDDYVSLPNKMISAYNAVFQTYDFKYIFKTDDDQMIKDPNWFFQKLINTITVASDNTNIRHYGGNVVNITDDTISGYNKLHQELPPNIPVLKTKYCSGRFYFLSRAAIIDLLAKTEKIRSEIFEDYAIGYHLCEEYKKTILHLPVNDIFKDMINN